MTQDELLKQVAETLDDLGIPYLITGSVASILYGEPRLTNDIDIVVELSSRHVPELLRAFSQADFYLEEEAIREALRRRGQFNLIHPASGLKVDFIVSPGTAFDASRFARSRQLPAGEGFTASWASAEDVILKKLEFYRRGGSDKHLRDIAGILRVSGDQLDYAYLEDWAQRLDMAGLWKEVRSRTRPT